MPAGMLPIGKACLIPPRVTKIGPPVSSKMAISVEPVPPVFP